MPISGNSHLNRRIHTWTTLLASVNTGTVWFPICHHVHKPRFPTLITRTWFASASVVQPTQKSSPTSLALVPTSFTLIHRFNQSLSCFISKLIRLQLSIFCVQAPQHLHQDVVLPSSAPLNFMLSKAFSTTFAEEWNTIDVHSNCMCALQQSSTSLHWWTSGNTHRFHNVLYTLFSLVETRSSVPLAPSVKDWASRTLFLFSHRQPRTLSLSTWETCNRCRSTLSHRSSRGSPHWLLRLWVRHNTTDSSPVLLLPALRYNVCRVSALYCCAELCSGHPRPSRWLGPSVPWVSLPGPTGVPTGTQAEWYQGQNANPLAALLLQLLRLLQLLHACARDQHTLDKNWRKKLEKQTGKKLKKKKTGNKNWKKLEKWKKTGKGKLEIFVVFLSLWSAVLNCVRATHGLPADRAPVYRGCPCRDRLGCPLIPRQNGIKDKTPTLWLLCCCNCWDCFNCCMCVRVRSTLDMLSQKAKKTGEKKKLKKKLEKKNWKKHGKTGKNWKNWENQRVSYSCRRALRSKKKIN